MEATLLGKLLIGVLGGVGLLYLLVLRPWRPRRMWARRAPAVDLLFLAALACGTVAVLGAPPFARLAGVLVDQTTLPDTLAAIDGRIHEIETLPDRIWDDLTARFGWAEPEPAPPLPPPGPGVVTRAVLPGIEAVVEILLRASVYWSSLLALAVCLVMRIALGVTRAVARATTRGPRPEAMLEGRIAALEERLIDPAPLDAGPRLET